MNRKIKSVINDYFALQESLNFDDDDDDDGVITNINLLDEFQIGDKLYYDPYYNKNVIPDGTISNNQKSASSYLDGFNFNGVGHLVAECVCTAKQAEDGMPRFAYRGECDEFTGQYDNCNIKDDVYGAYMLYDDYIHCITDEYTGMYNEICAKHPEVDPESDEYDEQRADDLRLEYEEEYVADSFQNEYPHYMELAFACTDNIELAEKDLNGYEHCKNVIFGCEMFPITRNVDRVNEYVALWFHHSGQPEYYIPALGELRLALDNWEQFFIDIYAYDNCNWYASSTLDGDANVYCVDGNHYTLDTISRDEILSVVLFLHFTKEQLVKIALNKMISHNAK